jgi:hypothetical protein
LWPQNKRICFCKEKIFKYDIGQGDSGEQCGAWASCDIPFPLWSPGEFDHFTQVQGENDFYQFLGIAHDIEVNSI